MIVLEHPRQGPPCRLLQVELHVDGEKAGCPPRHGGLVAGDERAYGIESAPLATKHEALQGTGARRGVRSELALRTLDTADRRLGLIELSGGKGASEPHALREVCPIPAPVSRRLCEVAFGLIEPGSVACDIAGRATHIGRAAERLIVRSACNAGQFAAPLEPRCDATGAERVRDTHSQCFREDLRVPEKTSETYRLVAQTCRFVEFAGESGRAPQGRRSLHVESIVLVRWNPRQGRTQQLDRLVPVQSRSPAGLLEFDRGTDARPGVAVLDHPNGTGAGLCEVRDEYPAVYRPEAKKVTRLRVRYQFGRVLERSRGVLVREPLVRRLRCAGEVRGRTVAITECSRLRVMVGESLYEARRGGKAVLQRVGDERIHRHQVCAGSMLDECLSRYRVREPERVPRRLRDLQKAGPHRTVDGRKRDVDGRATHCEKFGELELLTEDRRQFEDIALFGREHGDPRPHEVRRRARQFEYERAVKAVGFGRGDDVLPGLTHEERVAAGQCAEDDGGSGCDVGGHIAGDSYELGDLFDSERCELTPSHTLEPAEIREHVCQRIGMIRHGRSERADDEEPRIDGIRDDSREQAQCRRCRPVKIFCDEDDRPGLGGGEEQLDHSLEESGLTDLHAFCHHGACKRLLEQVRRPCEVAVAVPDVDERQEVPDRDVEGLERCAEVLDARPRQHDCPVVVQCRARRADQTGLADAGSATEEDSASCAELDVGPRGLQLRDLFASGDERWLARRRPSWRKGRSRPSPHLPTLARRDRRGP